MTLEAKEVCPVDHGSGGSAWSIGDILVLTFFLAILSYLIVGLSINIFVRKLSGPDVFPNNAFWTTLPELVKDGGKFAFSKTTQILSKNGGSYQQM